MTWGGPVCAPPRPCSSPSYRADRLPPRGARSEYGRATMKRFLTWLRQQRSGFSEAARRGARRGKGRRAVRPAVERLEDRWVPADMTYHNGPMMANVNVSTIYY